ncbi:hypothetical protein [Microlunatus soli]|nr:hypothetical protein [Microlunatus soli]
MTRATSNYVSGTSRRWPLTVKSTLVVVGLVLVFGLLRLVSGLSEPTSQTEIYTPNVVVVGVTGRYQPTATDDKIISAHTDDVQAGAISTRPAIQGECAAAGWLTVGAGRRTTAGGLCDPAVSGSGTAASIPDWQQRLAKAGANAGDARLGTLAAQSKGCVQAVGAGAALAAANPDGTLDRYRTAQQFAAGGYRPDCPITLVDAGQDSDRVISRLADREDVTLIVTGIGPAAGSHDENLQLIYRLGTTLPGLMTSESTRREGIVTLIDLTRTLVGFAHDNKPLPAGLPLDGTAIGVQPQPVSTAILSKHLTTLHNLSSVAPVGYVVGGLIGVGLAVTIAIAAVRRRWAVIRPALAALATLTAALMLTGSFGWQAQQHPTPALLLTLVFWVAALAAATLGLSRWLKLPLPIVAAGLVMATYTTDAALGGVMQPGSLLNSRPVAGGRWYGFGNSTFGSYAVSAITVAGYVAHRFARAGRRWLPMVAVLIIGGLAVACEGWPSMGADFGGVISLTPTVLFLALAVSPAKITWPRLLIIGASAVVAVGLVSVIDWTRGAGHRSHLGDFVQRVISGDAWPIVLRKAVASGSTLIAPLGIIGIVVGGAIWIVIFRRLRHAITEQQFSTYHVTAITACATGIIGTLLNDAGISVFLTVTGPFMVTTVGLLYGRFRRLGWAGVVHGEDVQDPLEPDDGPGPAPTRPRDPSRSGNPAIRGRRRSS